jgi:hypothetical protein
MASDQLSLKSSPNSFIRAACTASRTFLKTLKEAEILLVVAYTQVHTGADQTCVPAIHVATNNIGLRVVGTANE